MPMNKTKPIPKGIKFNRLTIIRFHHKDKRWRRFYLCRCDCGTEKVIHGSLLKSGNTKSCGCLSREVKLARRLPGNRGVINHLILQYKRHARNRNLSFRLSYKRFSELIKGNCVYCGEPPSNVKITKNCKEGFVYSGIDRVDPKRGYSLGNVVSCCSLCNRAKNNLSLEQFKTWVKKLDAMAEQWG